MNYEELQENIKKTYVQLLDAVKDIEPGSIEWDFIWGLLVAAKEYLEEKKKALEVK